MYLCADKIRNLTANIRIIAPKDCASQLAEDTDQWKDFLAERTAFIEGSGFDITVSDVYRKAIGSTTPYIGKDQRRLPEFVSVSTFEGGYKISDDTYHLPPRYYLIQSAEVISLPSYLGAIVLPRSSFFNAECLLGFTRIAPGFSDQLRCGLHVCGDLGLDLDVGARFATVMFYEFSPGNTDTYKGIWQGGRLSTNNQKVRAF